MTPARGSSVIGLVRVSTEEQETSGAGLDAQEVSIRTLCEARGWTVEIIREAASGKTLAKRPELQSILARLESTGDPTKTLVVAKLDRLARSMLDYTTMLERAQRNGWALVCIDPNLDFSTPEGRVMASMLMAFAEYEREMIGQRTRKGMAAKARQGITFGRPRTMPAPTLARLRSLRREGLSYQRIADALNAEGVPGAQQGRWFKQSVLAAFKRYDLGED